jgi:anti-sigma B factor antagonist
MRAMLNEKIRVVASAGRRDGERILALAGVLNIHTIFDFQNAVREEASPVLIIDFSGVPFMDSAGLGAVVGAYVRAQKAQSRIVFAGMNERLKALVEMTRLGQMLPMYSTVAEAETALG